MALGSVCICLAYARALVGLILGQMPEGTPGTFVHCQRTSIQCAQARMKDVGSLKVVEFLIAANFGQSPHFI